MISKEFDITWRMLADNVLASFTPILIFASAVCLRENLSLGQAILVLLKSIFLGSIYTYVFDASNQARGAGEDKINKPYRPIPAGLLSPAGAMRRFRVAMALYTVVGWAFGVLRWVLIWQLATTIINVWCHPRHYFWCKTMCMSLGVLSQLSQAWQLVGPFDATGKRWILFMATAFPPPLIFEDVRDMAGDKAIGRKTFALMFGELPIRIWFATIMTMMPVLVHVFLIEPEATTPMRVFFCDFLVTTICWATVIRSLILRSVASDRLTYYIFIFSYITVLTCGCILWA